MAEPKREEPGPVRGVESGTLGARSSPSGYHGSQGSTPTIGRKVDHVHKLERKHSSGDLHSRLKTRKLLGVGETDDGDVHRSKLSQILGHSEQLYVRLPRGLRLWQFLTALMFTTIGVWALIFPRHLFSFAMAADADVTAVLPVRLYGGALLSLSVIFWCTLQSVDKDIIRWCLLGSVVYFTIQTIVTTTYLVDMGTFRQHALRLLTYRVLFALISLFFYWAVGNKVTKIRKVNSSKDLTKEN